MRKKICDMLTLLKYAKNAAISEEHVTTTNQAVCFCSF